MDEIKLKGIETDNFKIKSIDSGSFKAKGNNSETLTTTLNPNVIIYSPSLDFSVIQNSMYLSILIRRLWR